nr:MAG TPA: hypothetical protein [Inoviridae sp.]
MTAGWRFEPPGPCSQRIGEILLVSPCIAG